MNRKALKTLFADDPEILALLSEPTSITNVTDNGSGKLDTLINILKKGDKGEPGEDGYTPVKGKDYFTDEEIQEIRKSIIEAVTPRKGVDYFDGKDYTLTKQDKKDIASFIDVPVVERVIERVEVIKEVPAEIDMEEVLKPLEKKLLDGMVKVDGRIKAIDQRWKGGGLSRVSHDSTLSGSGTPADPLIVVGGGGGFTKLTTAGTVNDSNLAFPFVSSVTGLPAAPTYIIINGAWNDKTLGPITWTGTTTATLSSPVGVGGSIFGFN